MRADYNAVEGFETGWYFPETLHPGDVLKHPEGSPELPTMEDYLEALNQRAEQVANMTPEELAQEKAHLASIPPIEWLPVND
jgi:hypothetical protein